LGTLDNESARQIFVEEILGMSPKFKKLILITHLEDVVEQFSNRIRVGTDKEGKSKIYN